MIRSMAKALAYAHDNDIVHSDFKPANVFLTRKKQIKVLDFGARARGADCAAARQGGSLARLARARRHDARVREPGDARRHASRRRPTTFSLSRSSSYELLTGRHPFDYERPDAARFAAAQGHRRCPGCRARSEKPCMRAFAAERGVAATRTPPSSCASSKGRARPSGPCCRRRRPWRSWCAIAVVSGLGTRTAARRVAFEDLAPEVRAQFERAVSEGQTALSFGAAGHQRRARCTFRPRTSCIRTTPRAVRGLEAVADRFLASVRTADATARREVFGSALLQRPT